MGQALNKINNIPGNHIFMAVVNKSIVWIILENGQESFLFLCVSWGFWLLKCIPTFTSWRLMGTP